MFTDLILQCKKENISIKVCISQIDGTVEISLSGQLNRANKGVDLMVFHLKIKEDSHPFVFHSRHSPTVREISIGNSDRNHDQNKPLRFQHHPRISRKKTTVAPFCKKRAKTFSVVMMPPAAAMTSEAH